MCDSSKDLLLRDFPSLSLLCLFAGGEHPRVPEHGRGQGRESQGEAALWGGNLLQAGIA